jgi:hypothetical protein
MSATQQSQQQPMAFQPNQVLTVSLEAQDWRVVLAGLDELPHKFARAVLDRLMQQINTAQAQAQAQAQMPARPNGQGRPLQDDAAAMPA